MVYNITEYVELAEHEIMRLGRGRISQVAYSPDGNTLAVAGTQGVSLYPLDRPAAVRLLPHTEQVYSVSTLAKKGA
jgi:WD40 repeat protein